MLTFLRKSDLNIFIEANFYSSEATLWKILTIYHIFR